MQARESPVDNGSSNGAVAQLRSGRANGDLPLGLLPLLPRPKRWPQVQENERVLHVLETAAREAIEDWFLASVPNRKRRAIVLVRRAFSEPLTARAVPSKALCDGLSGRKLHDSVLTLTTRNAIFL